MAAFDLINCSFVTWMKPETWPKYTLVGQDRSIVPTYIYIPLLSSFGYNETRLDS